MTERDEQYHATVLVVDDEESIRESLRMVLEYEGYRVEEAGSGSEALARIRQRKPEAVLLDVKMPGMGGIELLQVLQERGYEMPVIIVTGHGDVEMAIDATRRGAFDFFEKPLQRERILVSLRNAIQNYRLQLESVPARYAYDELVGSSAAMRKLRDTISKAAPTPATVLITGESGTGKELVARAIHRLSSRSERPLVQVNCAAIPDELIESELFGHEKGSFTGASRKQIGKFVAADSGTIFLDEVGDMSARNQAKVLRVLQDGDVEPVGSQQVAKVDVRVVAATNRDLAGEIAEGRFREDLYYRLNVIPILTPPLRDHLEDLDELTEYFIRRFSESNNYPLKSLEEGALAGLRSHPWKGNIRELKNVVERLLILSPESTIRADDVAEVLGGAGGDDAVPLLAAKSLKEFREASERLFLLRKLDENDWNVTRTAEAIETPRSNLYKKLESYNIKREDHSG